MVVRERGERFLRNAPASARACGDDDNGAEPRLASRTGTRDAAPAEASTESAPAEEEVSSAPASGTGAAIVAEARKYVGTPYKHGGASPGAFDCSGFTSYVFSKFGVSLPRSSGAQRGAGRIVSASKGAPPISCGGRPRRDLHRQR